METTRHFTAKVFIVEGGTTALHRHDRLGIRVAPGGHVDRDELPHEAALREVREETGLNAELVTDWPDVDLPAGTPLPQPRYQMLYDVDVLPDGEVVHQHVDHVYFGRVESREITPGPGEAPADEWDWYTPAELRESDADPDTVRFGIEAVEAVEASRT